MAQDPKKMGQDPNVKKVDPNTKPEVKKVDPNTKPEEKIEVKKDPFVLSDLPWKNDAFQEKGISKETIEYHYGKHHAGYVRKLNMLANENKDLANLTLEEIILTKQGGAFNNAAQIWNHTFYWNCMTPIEDDHKVGIREDITVAIVQRFTTMKEFEKEFKERATNHFGAGWLWLVFDPNKNSLELVDGHDAHNPLKDGMHPLLTIDVWEHAYYIDYRNNRGAYINAFWELINWKFVNTNFQKCAKKK